MEPIGTKHVYIIGSKGIPAAYGGFETFVDRLTAGRQDPALQYHVACMNGTEREFTCHQARCYRVRVPRIGPAKAIFYDLAAFRAALRDIRKRGISGAVVYILACRIGPFMWFFRKRCDALGVRILVNPDGHEWMRAKWSRPVRAYWKVSERGMTKYADRMVCDSVHMERYIASRYACFSPRTVYIAYGADTEPVGGGARTDAALAAWYEKNGLRPGGYYLIVGRFVPENNYETIIREFQQAKTDKKLALITNAEKNRYYDRLQRETGMEQDGRICFAGTVYDAPLLRKIRENAAGYLHGHEVGGTNPSLLEALAATDVNLLLDVPFNREVGQDAALYWSKEPGSLKALLEEAQRLSEAERRAFGEKARGRIREAYSWEKIVKAYEALFLS